MRHFRTNNQVAIAVTATLLAGSWLSTAKAKGDERAAVYESNQPGWYRLWNELGLSQPAMQFQGSLGRAMTTPKQIQTPADTSRHGDAREVNAPASSTTFRTGPVANQSRWFNVSDESSDDKPHDLATANPHHVPREVVPAVAKPIVAQLSDETTPTPIRQGAEANSASSGLSSKTQVNSLRKGSQSNGHGTRREFANFDDQAPPSPHAVQAPQLLALRLPSFTGNTDRQVSSGSNTEFKPLLQQPEPSKSTERAALPNTRELLTYISLDRAPASQRHETEREVASVPESSGPREVELGLPAAEPKAIPESTQPARLPEGVQTEEHETAIGLTSAPRESETQPEKRRENRAPALLTSAEPVWAAPIARCEPGPISLSQPAEQTVNLQLDVATLHRLQLNDPIDRVEVADRQVCEALNDADRGIKLLAKQNGETMVTIYYTTARAPDVYAVKVGLCGKQQGQLASDLHLQNLIVGMFPDSNVMITSTDQSLVVSGAVRGNAEAIRILSFVRSLRLVPVVDKLTVQR